MGAVQLPGDANCPAVSARSLAQQAAALGLLGRREESDACAARALGPAESCGDETVLAYVVSVLRENARRAGRHAEALGHSRRALALAERAGRPTVTAFERANQAELHLLCGDLAEADRLARAAVELAEPFGGAALALALTALARVQGHLDPAAAAPLLARAERCARDSGHQQAVEGVRSVRAALRTV